jgi:hypothetical protein
MVEAGHLWPSRNEWRPACTILGGGIPAIHPSARNRNSRKFISTIPDIHSYRAGAELYSSTSSMLWVGSCGQFALDWFGLHSILVPPPGTMISCPTYSIFPGKRKSSSMHRNVLSTSFRSGSLAIFPLAVGGLFLALSMHELRLTGILGSSSLQASHRAQPQAPQSGMAQLLRRRNAPT